MRARPIRPRASRRTSRSPTGAATATPPFSATTRESRCRARTCWWSGWTPAATRATSTSRGRPAQPARSSIKCDAVKAARLLGLGFCLLLSVAAPRARGADARETNARDRLPEDPVAGAKSTQQWKEFMVAEEHERQLHYDRARLKQHRAMLKFLVATRARYDRA